MPGVTRVRRQQQDSKGGIVPPSPLRDSIINAWATNNRTTVFLIEQLPPVLWNAAVPGAPRRTVRMIGGHIHNARCAWIKTLGRPLGISVPPSVDRRRVGRVELIRALNRSGEGTSTLLVFCVERNGQIPPTAVHV